MRITTCVFVSVLIVFGFVLSTIEKGGPSGAAAFPVPGPNPGFGSKVSSMLNKHPKRSTGSRHHRHKKPGASSDPSKMSNRQRRDIANQLENPQRHSSHAAART
uniref:Secreted protein n=1 Tax=Rhipicephalus zambeziensis TaxID=60191 RepID=A0A224YIA8_9ACAR